MPLPVAPDFGSLAAAAAEEKPATPEGRIDRWQHRLLDLSLRNRLLNFKQTQQTLPFLCPNISGLEDLLAEGNKVRILSLPEENPQGDRDTQLHRQKTSQDPNLEFARQAMQRQNLNAFTSELSVAAKQHRSQTEINQLPELAKSLLACAGEDMSLLFHKQFSRFPAALTDLRTAIANYDQARAAAAADYEGEPWNELNAMPPT